MRITLLLSFLLIAGSALAQSTDTLETADDQFTVFVDSTLEIAAPGLLDNDTVETSDSLRIMLVAGPSNGSVELGIDGSFVYTPNAGFSGMDGFTYMLETLPLQHLEIDTMESALDLDMTVLILGLARSDFAAVRLGGSASLYMDPVVNPAENVQLYDMSLVNVDSVDMFFDYGAIVGRLSAHADPDSFQIRLTQVGLPVPVVEDAFLQTDNILNVIGKVELEGTGVIGSQIPAEPIALDTNSPPVEIDGSISIADNEISVLVPIALADTFNVVPDAADVILNLSGYVIGHGPLRVPAQSNVGTVVITVDPKTTTGVTDEVPFEFALSQNYPNPFNPVTTIAFSIPTADRVMLKVFDTLGREIATLVDEVATAGRHEVQFEAGHLPSGMYLYRLDAGGETEIRKMVVLK